MSAPPVAGLILLATSLACGDKEGGRDSGDGGGSDGGGPDGGSPDGGGSDGGGSDGGGSDGGGSGTGAHGDFTLATEAQLAELCDATDEVWGSVHVTGSLLTDLDGLSCLVAVHGQLLIDGLALTARRD